MLGSTLRRCFVAVMAVASGALANAVTFHAPHGDFAARASSLTALQLADHALMTIAGPEDEGPYTLIDPIGPGGASGLAAADEVFASTMIGGRYSTYQPLQDPFAQPVPGADYPPMPYGPPKDQLP